MELKVLAIKLYRTKATTNQIKQTCQPIKLPGVQTPGNNIHVPNHQPVMVNQQWINYGYVFQ